MTFFKPDLIQVDAFACHVAGRKAQVAVFVVLVDLMHCFVRLKFQP